MPYCTPCKRTFVTAAAVRQHLAASSSIHPHCPECNRNFVDQQALEQHLGTMRCRRVYCRDCKISFTNQNALNQHRNSTVQDVGCSHLDQSIVTQEALVQGPQDEGHTRLASYHKELLCGELGRGSRGQDGLDLSPSRGGFALGFIPLLWNTKQKALALTTPNTFTSPAPIPNSKLLTTRPPVYSAAWKAINLRWGHFCGAFAQYFPLSAPPRPCTGRYLGENLVGVSH